MFGDSYLSNEIRGQFHQPIDEKHKCAGTHSLVQKMPFSFTNKSVPKFNIIYTTRSYAQLLCSMVYDICHKDQCKSIGAKAACKMMMKLTRECTAFSLFLPSFLGYYFDIDKLWVDFCWVT